MEDFHRHIAAIALAALRESGFVLAGGYALSEAGIGDRLSADIDLFTNMADPDAFAGAVASVMTALEGAGLVSGVSRRAELFAELVVERPETDERFLLQLGVDYRRFPPVTIAGIPVLDERDAVANKLAALYSRGEARDYLDIDAALESRRFTLDELLALADANSATPLDRQLLATRFRECEGLPLAAFHLYGLTPAEVRALGLRFMDRADEAERDDRAGVEG